MVRLGGASEFILIMSGVYTAVSTYTVALDNFLINLSRLKRHPRSFFKVISANKRKKNSINKVEYRAYFKK